MAERSQRTIVLKDVSRWFGTQPGVREVDLEIEPGRSLGVIGPNGSGKTTLLKILAGHLSPTTGEIRVREDGAERGFNPRENLGYAGHSLMLYEQLTPLENLSFFASLYQRTNSDDRIRFLLDTLNLWQRRDSRVSQLSSGMKKKLSLSRALLHEPDVLVLDEPFRGIDDASREKMATLFDQFSERGGTMLLASHRLEHIRRFCERILVLRNTSPVWSGDISSMDEDELRYTYRQKLGWTNEPEGTP